MRAILCTNYHSSEDLKIEEIAKPVIKKNELLIKIMASTVASGDCVVKNAANPFVRIAFGLKRPRNPILGTDLAGVIEAIGEEVTEFSVGDHVIASTGMKFGCHADYIALKKDKAIAKIPNSLSFNKAVTLSFGGVAGLHFLRKMNRKENSKLLIYGASGAVGTSTVQLAKYYGFEVTAVCSSANIDLVRSLGADFTLDYTANDWKDTLTEFDYIFDAVGKTKKTDWSSHLKNDGAFFTIAKGLVKENSNDLNLLVDLLQKGKIKPVIDKIYSMNQIAQAYAYVETGRKRGNVVLDFSLDNGE